MFKFIVTALCLTACSSPYPDPQPTSTTTVATASDAGADAGATTVCTVSGAMFCREIIEAFCYRTESCSPGDIGRTADNCIKKYAVDCLSPKYTDHRVPCDEPEHSACADGWSRLACSDLKGNTAQAPAACDRFWAKL